MKLATLNARAVIVDGTSAIDIERASEGRFPSTLRGVLDVWDEFTAWAATAELGTPDRFEETELDAPISDPRQIFAIGLNYRDHATEAGLPFPDHLVVFTKFQSSIGAPFAEVDLPSEDVDYEVELVIVVGRVAHKVSEADAWDHVAGFSVGQDLSERVVQRRGPAAQFSLGKSYPNFTLFGPVVATVDEFEDPDALGISAVLEGPEAGQRLVVQDGTTADLIFPVSRIIADLSQIVTLLPGDLIFTGTPAGVGLSRGIVLQPGQTLTSTLEGVGSIRNVFL
ncbi:MULTISPECIES: fumarylacetoacetate hydrolase family protein [Microbacterium]|uniref:2-keto-4-pentenoate hydratase/2-oxohepta-3-ene-1,7-dioic acid hydratase (Catechol pathway) n=1 Tax=Microbacterium saccharophilum TaxID=1213358 RepID=A0A7Z7D2S6_9MICO|nr:MULTISPECIES: fumarylacetoacetate hydrolase family protein [Microbacterium]SFI61568.1 2-keto-4-pentenoate hydratase/2-oxohepta-3-ene-1,7-dioic acid hydratase (catechol pathway) [Microbacterium saccharophilum]